MFHRFIEWSSLCANHEARIVYVVGKYETVSPLSLKCDVIRDAYFVFCSFCCYLKAYADALLVIPKLLAQNSGFDPQETIVKLQVSKLPSV